MLQRDNSLLGPTPRDPFEASNSYRKSNADFADVFGGPPRKSAIYDYSRSSGESADVYGREESVRSRWPRTSLESSPVFGECLSPSTRQRDLGDDFFSDIFRGSDSVCSSPRKADRDVFSSASSSRVLSPVRPLPPRSEAFSGSTSLPSPLSFKFSHFSKEVPKGQENYVSSPELTPNRSKGSNLNAKTDVASTVKQASESHDDLENTAHASIFRTSLSSRFTYDEEPPKSTKSTTVDFERPFAKDPKVNNRPGHFHFSIYRWASKGVMLVVPPNTREGAKSDRRLAGIPVPFLQGVELPSSNKVMPSEYLHKGSTNEVNLKKTTKKSPTNSNEVLTQKLESDNFPSENTEPGKPFEKRQAVPDSKNNTGTFNKINEVPAPMQDVQMPTQLNLRDLMNDHFGTEEKEEKFSKEEDDMVSTATSTRSTQSPAELKRRTSKRNVMGQSGTQDMSVEDKMLAGRVKGKVKDFIRIFNEDISCKPADIIESLSRSTETRTSGKDRVEEYDKRSLSLSNEEHKSSSDNGVQLDATVLIQKDLEDEKLQFSTETPEQEKYKYFKEKRGISPSFESMNFDASFAEPHYEVEEILVENVLQEPQSVDTPKTDLSLEEIQISDLKVREWSRGKEANIRSLLSTLQFVLWTGSGWKPVALVDILEGASVKRAYQKALLCLHPDKLQQRGAPKHQTYIAEKVFDILQEAWDHFNSTNSF